MFLLGFNYYGHDKLFIFFYWVNFLNHVLFGSFETGILRAFPLKKRGKI